MTSSFMTIVKYVLATIAVVMIVCVVTAVVLPVYQQSREASRREQTRKNLEQIGRSLHQGHDNGQAVPAMDSGGETSSPPDVKGLENTN